MLLYSVVHQKITTDTTEFKYFETDQAGVIRQKKLYLDPFLDLYNSEIISHRISKRPNALAVMEALEEAIEIMSDCPFRRTFHSDQGCAYQMKSYAFTLNEQNIFQRMSRKGNCLDNSPIENFFGILKQETYHGRVYCSFNELKQAINPSGLRTSWYPRILWLVVPSSREVFFIRTGNQKYKQQTR